MSDTSSARRRSPVPLRWLRAGGDLSQPDFMQSMRPAPLDALQALVEALFSLSCSPPRPEMYVASPPYPTRRNIKPHSARRPAAYPTSRDFVPRRFLDAGPLSVRRVSSLPASKNLYKTGRTDWVLTLAGGTTVPDLIRPSPLRPRAAISASECIPDPLTNFD
jgi:hypothetical protein